MPDPNKLAKQKEVVFKILPTCGICRFGYFTFSKYGGCRKFDYQHEKHTDIKQMGIHIAGSCPSFEMDKVVEGSLVSSGFIDGQPCHGRWGIGVCTLGTSCVYKEGHAEDHSYGGKNCKEHTDGCP